MLLLTRKAVQAIRQVIEAHPGEGLRLYAGSRRFSRVPAIQVEVAGVPDVDDTVLDVDGARLYLDPETLRVLDDKVLDADLSGDEPRFLVYQQISRVR
jgi:Fe-S cluster assembly iron-binding protein IscA